MNETRALGLALQQVRDCKTWSFGPFFAGRTAVGDSVTWVVGMAVTPWHNIAIQVAWFA